jgi:hypothetical protein
MRNTLEGETWPSPASAQSDSTSRVESPRTTPPMTSAGYPFITQTHGNRR